MTKHEAKEKLIGTDYGVYVFVAPLPPSRRRVSSRTDYTFFRNLDDCSKRYHHSILELTSILHEGTKKVCGKTETFFYLYVTEMKNL